MKTIKEYWIEYLDKNNLQVVLDNQFVASYLKFEPKGDKPQNEHWINELVTAKRKFNEIKANDKVFNFFEYVFSKYPEDNSIVKYALQFLPNKKDSNYSAYEYNLFSTFKKYPNKLFLLATTPSYYGSNVDKMDKLFKLIDSQEKRNIIIDNLIKSKGFNGLEFQKITQNLIDNYILNKKKYDGVCYKLNIIQDTPDLKLQSESVKGEFIKLTFNIEHVSMYNIEKSKLKSASNAILGVRELISSADKIGITDILTVMDQSQKNIDIIWFGEKLNYDFLSELTTLFIKETLKPTIQLNKVVNILNDTRMDFQNEIITLAKYNSLNRSLPKKEEKIKSLKI